jgi:hypothetical protein
MKKRESSLQILAVVIAIAILGILLIPAVNAGNFSVEKMPVEITIKIDGDKIAETNAEEITIKAFKDQEVKIDFKARIVNCESCLDIIAIKDKEIDLLSPVIEKDEQDSGCLASGTLILVSKTKIPEENIEYFNFVFLSSGKDKYGAGGGDKTIQELLKDWQSLKSKTVDKMITSIRGDTINSNASDDSMAVRKIKVRIEEAPSIEIKRIEWIYEKWPHKKRTGLKFTGTSNLPKDTSFDCTFLGSFGETTITEEASYDGKIEFSIAIEQEIDAGEYFLRIDVDEFGWSSEEISVTVGSTQPISTPTIEKFTPSPVSTSYSPEIQETPESTPTPTWPPPTIIPEIPETSETPGMSGVASILVIVTVAITIIIKRKK